MGAAPIPIIHFKVDDQLIPDSNGLFLGGRDTDPSIQTLQHTRVCFPDSILQMLGPSRI